MNRYDSVTRAWHSRLTFGYITDLWPWSNINKCCFGFLCVAKILSIHSIAPTSLLCMPTWSITSTGIKESANRQRYFACIRSHLKLTKTDIFALCTRWTLLSNKFNVPCLFSTIFGWSCAKMKKKLPQKLNTRRKIPTILLYILLFAYTARWSYDFFFKTLH